MRRTPRNPEEVPFIRKIVENPDDDLPRLVYADWLEEQGRSERAELIRVQCQLEKLKEREQELLEKFGLQWAEEAYDGLAESGVFHRGFPEECSMRLATFMENHDYINEGTPMTRIRMIGRCSDDMDQDLAAFAQLPVIHQLRALEFDEVGVQSPHSQYTPEAVQALASSPYLKNLKKLRLHSPLIGLEGARIIAQSPNFQHLTHLCLTDPNLNGLEFGHLDALIRSPHLTKLQELQLGDREWGPYMLNSWRKDRGVNEDEGRAH